MKTLIVFLGLLSFKAFSGDFDPWKHFQFKTIKDFTQQSSSSWSLDIDSADHLPLTTLWEDQHLASLEALVRRFDNVHQVDFLVFYLSNLSASDFNFLTQTLKSHSYFLDFLTELKGQASIEALEMAVLSNMDYSSKGVIDDITLEFLKDPLHQETIRKVTNVYQVEGLFDFWNIFFNRLLYVSDDAHPYLQFLITENSDFATILRKKVERLYKYILKIEDPLALELLRTIYTESLGLHIALNDGEHVRRYVVKQLRSAENIDQQVLPERILNQKNWNPELVIKRLIEVLNYWGELDLVQSEKDLELAKRAVRKHFSGLPGNHLSDCLRALQSMF